MGIYLLNMYIGFGKMSIFTRLILPIFDQERSFHHLISSLIYLFNALNFYHTCISPTSLELIQDILYYFSYYKQRFFHDFFLGSFVILYRRPNDILFVNHESCH